MNRKFLVVVVCSLSTLLHAQKPAEKPRLVVGIVVDQMRQEYLYRFSPKFVEGGFKRMMSGGFMLKNAHYNYVPTYTGPGHASIYTGSTPAVHGIVSNDWYDKELKKSVNCVNDPNQQLVGDAGNGTVSPWRLLTTTITDELKLATQLRAKVVGVSIKDRGAVLPAGHAPDGAYWYDGKTGHFITSSFYVQEMPTWAKKFNDQNLAASYMTREWKTLLPIGQYTESGPDDSPYEHLGDKEKPVFPYKMTEIRKSGSLDAIVYTPFGDDLLTEMAKAALAGEELGKDDVTDFLSISFSTPDLIGHSMGPNSIEVEDTYLRLDRNIQDLLAELDKSVGVGKYTVFLTADHAVAEVSQYLMDNSMPGNYINMEKVEEGLTAFLQKYFPAKKLIESISNDQVYLNQEIFGGDPKSGGIDFLIASELITKYLMATPGIAQVFSENTLRQSDYGEKGVKGMIVRGYHHKRSGDIAFVLESGWVDNGGHGTTGTTHGSPYSYDTHVPVVFYGAGIKKGSSSQFHSITDIAPTLSVLLSIKFPSGCTGQPVSEMLD